MLYNTSIVVSTPTPPPLITSEGHSAENLRQYSNYSQLKQPNDDVLGRLIFKVPHLGSLPYFVPNCLNRL